MGGDAVDSRRGAVRYRAPNRARCLRKSSGLVEVAGWLAWRSSRRAALTLDTALRRGRAVGEGLNEGLNSGSSLPSQMLLIPR